MMKFFFKILILAAAPFTALAQEGTTYFSLQWLNDFFYLPSPTDYYFSNGLSIDLGLKALEDNPFNRILINGGERFRHQYGLRLVQNLYTPVAKDTTVVVPGDRPFASYLTVSSVAVVVNPGLRLKWHSELQLGVLGKFAGGQLTQNFVHSLTPNSEVVAGWSNEVKPDVVINYNVLLEKGVINTSWFNANLRLGGRLGTLYTDLTPGLYLELGLLDHFFESPLAWDDDPRFRVKLFSGVDLRIVGYDATLSGGIFNPDDRFRRTIAVERFQPSWESGLTIAWKKISTTMGLVARSSEFEGGLPHRYGYITLRFRR